MAQCRFHAGAATGQQDRSGGAVLDGPFECTPRGRRRRDQDDFVALPTNPKDSVAVFLTAVLDVATSERVLDRVTNVFIRHAMLAR